MKVIQEHVATEPTAVPSKAHSALPECREASVRAQKLHWTGKESCWSASSPYLFPGMNIGTVLLSRTEGEKKGNTSTKAFHVKQKGFMLPLT